MNLKEFFKTTERGEMSLLAKTIGAHIPDVSDWKAGHRPVPVRYCVAIEQATGGAVTRKDLRPDDYMEIWPELEER